MQYDYNQLLTTVRKRLSTINRSNVSEQFYSDRSRVIYNSSFRRLQQKAQVFSLEPNASVRTRLTHSSNSLVRSVRFRPNASQQNCAGVMF